jgi:NADP-dependent 3-hydroxy acid dehydrogenase YdfG
VNLWGVVRVLQAVLPHMRATRKGHVINLRSESHYNMSVLTVHSSTSGIRGLPANDFYTGEISSVTVSDLLQQASLPWKDCATVSGSEIYLLTMTF